MTTLQEQIAALLGRTLVEDKTGGAASSTIEAAAVLESIALNLSLQPRTALYFAHLARNALLKYVTDEIAAAQALQKTIQDLGNQSYAIKDLDALHRARSSLLQLEKQGQLLAPGTAFQSFDSAASEFLATQLAKNVKRQGRSDLVRPSAEAAAALPSDYQAVQVLHAEVVQRLASLLTCISNFSAYASAGAIGINVAFRVRQLLSAMIDDLTKDSEATSSRDHALQIVAARSALRLIGAPPGIFDPKVDKTKTLPNGYAIDCAVDQTQLEVSSILPLPWQFESGLSISTTFSPAISGPTSTFAFPLSGNHPAMVSTNAGPFVVQPQASLFLIFSATSRRVRFNNTLAPVVLTTAQIAIIINAQAGDVVLAQAVGGILIITSLTSEQFSLQDSLYLDPDFFDVSAREVIGLPFLSDDGYRSPWAVARVLTAITGIGFVPTTTGLILRTPLTSGESFAITFSTDVAHANLIFPSRLFYAESNVLRWSGNYLGQPATTIPTPLSVGDVVTTPFGARTVVEAQEDFVLLDSSVRWFSASPLYAESGLVLAWKELHDGLQALGPSWEVSGFSTDLRPLDSAISPLYGSPTPARRNEAQEALQVLVDTLLSLQTVLAGSPVPAGIETERRVADGILATLTERKFDRAKAFLLAGKIVEVFEMDWQTASFAGELMASASAIAKNDLRWPNRTADEGEVAYGIETNRVSP